MAFCLLLNTWAISSYLPRPDVVGGGGGGYKATCLPTVEVMSCDLD